MSNGGLSNLAGSVDLIKDFISKSYFNTFTGNNCSVLRVVDENKAKIGIRMLKISQIVMSDEMIELRLTNIYQTMHSLVNSLFMLIQGKDKKISLYIGFNSSMAAVAETALKQTLQGNFPGIVFETLLAGEINEVMNNIQQMKNGELKSVAAVSVVPSQKDENSESQNVQGMEKFMDTMQGKEFSAMIIATPYSEQSIKNKLISLESISTCLSSLETISMQYTQNISDTLTNSAANTISNSLTNSIMQAYTYGQNTATNYQTGQSHGMTISPLGVGLAFGSQTSSGISNGSYSGTSFGNTQASMVGKSFMISQGISRSVGESKTIVRSETNNEVKDLIEQINDQITRIKESEVHGLWDCCAYFVSQAVDTVIVAANSFKGLITGDKTHVEQSASVLWQASAYNPLMNKNISVILHSLYLGMPPVFSVNGNVQMTESIVTGKELSRMMDFPGSTAGDISVIRMAAFGRNIHLIGGKKMDEFNQNSFSVGKIMHMGKEEFSESRFEIEKLNAHVFAGGATGTGKTTAVCDILANLHQKGIPFTIIEPAKGEYGEIWGKMPGIEVYSTSPFRYRMLKLNPFVFQDNIHVLDHMERLISVFSTAWPLYAAQPAILRECVMNAYIKCGWDLKNSICIYTEKRFPNFDDVLAQLPEAIKNSKFVGESKGTYEGALQTRLSMLTKGLFRELLCNKYDTPNSELFDKNVIIDLSRLGSPETLSLTMGILLIRLYEHRICSGKQDHLSHVTVLEEAHNILKKASGIAQSEDGPSVSSKSVEVLTKCITELRFTGEGFIIADQSPGELDSNAIKNTSTKIIMRLQNTNDKDAVSSALALTELQTQELSKLGNGVAVVFQEGWTEPILTKFANNKKIYSIDAAKDISYQPEALYNEVLIVRAYIIRKVMEQAQKSVFELKYLLDCLKKIHNFSIWKIKDYEMMFIRFNDEYQKLKSSFANTRIKYLFYEKVFTELMGCENLFEIIPMPKYNDKMTEPYNEDPQFCKLCNEWRDSVYSAMDCYCKDLTRKEKSYILKILLVSDDNKSKHKMLVRKTIFKKKST